MAGLETVEELRDEIKLNWLLVYRIHDDVLVLALMNTGTHADIFGM